MNEMGYDIATPGNHEFDYGMEQFLKLAKEADFPYISANFNKDGELIFPPYVIEEFDGVKIAFVGVTTPESLTSVNPKYFQDEDGNFIYDFYQGESGELFYSKIQEAVDSARAEGADYVLAMCHLGNLSESKPYDSESLIRNTTGIDVVMDGHSHDSDQMIAKNKDGQEVPRTACGTKLENIGVVTIKTDGSIETGLFHYDLPMPAQEAFDLHNLISLELRDVMNVVSELLDHKVGFTSASLVSRDPAVKDKNGNPVRLVRNRETNLGDFFADALRSVMEADIGLLNGGAIRDDLAAGDITYTGLLTISPFGNTMSVLEVTGQQLLNGLEWGARKVPEEFGGFLQVSGLTYEIHTDIPNSCKEDRNGMFVGVDGEYRVQNVLVNGEPLDLEKTYTVAGNSFILQDHGDGYTAFDGCTVYQNASMQDIEVLLAYLEQLNGVVGQEYKNPYGQERILRVEGADSSDQQSGADSEEAA